MAHDGETQPPHGVKQDPVPSPGSSKTHFPINPCASHGPQLPRRTLPPFPGPAAALMHAETRVHRPCSSSHLSMCCYLSHSGAIQGSDSSGWVPAPRQAQSPPHNPCSLLGGHGAAPGSGPREHGRPLRQPTADLFPALSPLRFMGLLSIWSQNTWVLPCCRALKLSLRPSLIPMSPPEHGLQGPRTAKDLG